MPFLAKESNIGTGTQTRIAYNNLRYTYIMSKDFFYLIQYSEWNRLYIAWTANEFKTFIEILNGFHLSLGFQNIKPNKIHYQA